MTCTTGTDKDKGGYYTYTLAYSTAGLGQKAGGPGTSYPTFPLRTYLQHHFKEVLICERMDDMVMFNIK